MFYLGEKITGIVLVFPRIFPATVNVDGERDLIVVGGCKVLGDGFFLQRIRHPWLFYCSFLMRRQSIPLCSSINNNDNPVSYDFLSLQSIFGIGVDGCVDVGVVSARLVFYSYLEVSGWNCSAGVASSSWGAITLSSRRWIIWAFIDLSVHQILRCATCCQGWFQKSKRGFLVELELGCKLQGRHSFLPGKGHRAEAPVTSIENYQESVTRASL